MLIMSIGLLGVVALQTQALSQQRSAYLETQATNMAQDMMDRIRANKAQANEYRLGTNQTSGGGTLAANDKQEWTHDLADVLPDGRGRINVALPRIEVIVEFEDPTSANRNRTISLVSEL